MRAERPQDQEPRERRREPPPHQTSEMDHLLAPISPAPLSQRLKVLNAGTHLRVIADLLNPREVDRLIQILEANKDVIEDGSENKDKLAEDGEE